LFIEKVRWVPKTTKVLLLNSPIGFSGVHNASVKSWFNIATFDVLLQNLPELRTLKKPLKITTK